jgi:hypothetical protein
LRHFGREITCCGGFPEKEKEKIKTQPFFFGTRSGLKAEHQKEDRL